MSAAERPMGRTREVNFTMRRLALEISTDASRVAAVLTRPWAHDAALVPVENHLTLIAERALALRREIIAQRENPEAESRG